MTKSSKSTMDIQTSSSSKQCHSNNGDNNGGKRMAFTELHSRQIQRLRSVLRQDVEIHGRENFPTLRLPLHKLILHVRRKVCDANLGLKHVKMNGGAASFVLSKCDDFTYTDIDLIFPVRLENDGDFEKIRTIILQSLLELMPESNNQMMNFDFLKDIYIRKMIKVKDQDRWSLFSLNNDFGKCIEFKFVDRMRRPFEFSIDSFQITLDQLLENLDEASPVIQAESMFGNFSEALSHLNNRQIDTRKPEEIRGGGLLKYCFFLARGFHATQNCRSLEKYMCSRFFIDFSDISEQELKLLGFLENHFGDEYKMKSHYLQLLYAVIKESTVCLMGHERRQTLSMIVRLKNELSYHYCQYNPKDYPSSHYHQSYEKPSNYHRHKASFKENQSQKAEEAEYVPRQTLFYLPQNARQWIPVV